ncbi:MAG TPA: Gx transporter family protein [Clostridia bacterium]|nr:Gx transporter family protein [Clostridia bacterium]
MSSKSSALTKKIALLGILGAQALVLSALENLIPTLPGMPPGAKPGLSNIVTMYTAARIGLFEALYITTIKAAFAGLTRGPAAFFMSFSGGLLSTILMFGLLRLRERPFGIAGISVAAAVAHNTGQLFAAMVLTGTSSVLGYAPVLGFFAIITGLVTGTVLRIVLPALDKQRKFLT